MTYPPWSMFAIAAVFLVLFGVAAVATAVYVERNCSPPKAAAPSKSDCGCG